MTETTDSGILQQIAEALGDGWTAHPYRTGDADGNLQGPGGEQVTVDARAFNDEANPGRTFRAHLCLRTSAPGEVPCLDGTTKEGDTLAGFIDLLCDLAPHWQQAHAEDVARCAEVLAAPAAFAAEIASYMGEGWTGGAEDNLACRDRLCPVAFVRNGPLRVKWQPVSWQFGQPWKGIPGKWVNLPRLALRGTRERWPQRTNKENPTINVAATRPAKQIAGEITRRLLPGYLAALEDADQEDARHTASLTGVAGTVAMVQKVGVPLRVRPKEYGGSNEGETVELRFYTSIGEGDSLSGDITCTAGTVTLKMTAYTISPKTAKVVLSALAKAAEKFSPAE
jgi:hypothetical protein